MASLPSVHFPPCHPTKKSLLPAGIKRPLTLFTKAPRHQGPKAPKDPRPQPTKPSTKKTPAYATKPSHIVSPQRLFDERIVDGRKPGHHGTVAPTPTPSPVPRPRSPISLITSRGHQDPAPYVLPRPRANKNAFHGGKPVRPTPSPRHRAHGCLLQKPGFPTKHGMCLGEMTTELELIDETFALACGGPQPLRVPVTHPPEYKKKKKRKKNTGTDSYWFSDKR